MERIMMERRLGRVRVSMDYFSDYPREVKVALSELLILSSERDWATSEIVYTGYSAHFDSLEEGRIIPEYVPEMVQVNFGDCTGIAVSNWVRVPDLPHINLLKRLRDVVMALDGTSVENERLFDAYMDYMKPYGINQGE